MPDRIPWLLEGRGDMIAGGLVATEARRKVLVVEWRARWSAAQTTPRPELYLERRAGGLVVHDSRSEEASTLELGEAAGRILERLMSPATPARLEVELSDLGRDQVEREVSFLREHGLLFSDGEHLLSLPVAERPPEYVPKRWPMESLLAAFWRDPPAAAS